MKNNTYGATVSRPHMYSRNRVIADLLHEIIHVMENEGSLAPSVESGERYVVYLELDEQRSTRREDLTESRLRMELTPVKTQTIDLPPKEDPVVYNLKASRWKRFKQFIKGEWCNGTRRETQTRQAKGQGSGTNV